MKSLVPDDPRRMPPPGFPTLSAPTPTTIHPVSDTRQMFLGQATQMDSKSTFTPPPATPQHRLGNTTPQGSEEYPLYRKKHPHRAIARTSSTQSSSTQLTSSKTDDNNPAGQGPDANTTTEPLASPSTTSTALTPASAHSTPETQVQRKSSCPNNSTTSLD
ncbi:hypothetical protein DL98DRAFT_509859 [Cadophora sp. DSE1049]|nr:hypothetical protein DL98DRAFT_509859 [Cadophora sp. DSE1049]